MDIIGEIPVVDQCCGWQVKQAAHHDVWLMKLKRRSRADVRSFVQEVDSQQAVEVLPPSLISVVDILYFANLHQDRLDERAVELAEQVFEIAVELRLTGRITLMEEHRLVDSMVKGASNEAIG